MVPSTAARCLCRLEMIIQVISGVVFIDCRAIVAWCTGSRAHEASAARRHSFGVGV